MLGSPEPESAQECFLKEKSEFENAWYKTDVNAPCLLLRCDWGLVSSL